MTSAKFGAGGARWDELHGVVPSPLPRVSVIIPYFEQPHDLERAMIALQRQSYPAELLEIIVVDDGSARAPVVPPGVHLLRQEDSGFRAAAARNLGARSASGDILCFLDADCAPEPDYVAELTRLPALVPDLVAVGFRRHADLTGLDLDAPLTDLPARALLGDPAWLRDGYKASGNLLHSNARSFRYIISAVIACTRAFFVESGGFDESFVAYGGEDWDWAWRCWNRGALFAHVPTAVAWHNGADAGGRDRDPGAVNDETRTLQASIPISGSRPHALLTGPTDVAVTVKGPATAAQLVICADSLFRQLPTARIYLDGSVAAELSGDPRVVSGPPPLAPYLVCVTAPIRIESGADLRQLIDRVGVGTTGAIHIGDDRGILLSFSSARVAARRARWGDEVFEDLRLPPDGIVRRLTSDEPSLAAYYGDWD